MRQVLSGFDTLTEIDDYISTTRKVAEMPKKKTTVPSNETGEARFVRLATLKTNGVLKGLKALSRLTGKKAVSTPVQRTAIKNAIETAVKDMEAALAGQKSETTGFKL